MRNFLHPTRIDYNIEETVFAESMLFDVQKKGNIIVDIHIAPTLTMLTEKGEDGRFLYPVYSENFSSIQFTRFNNLTYKIGKSVRLSELNNDALAGLIISYFHHNNFDEVQSRNKKCREALKFQKQPDFNKLTFGQLRNIFSCILKTDEIFHQIPGLQTPEKRSEVTTVYNRYIIDRDCYTHGKLYFLLPDYNPVLRVQLTGEDDSYLTLNDQIFSDNFEIYLLLNSYIQAMLEALEQKCTFREPAE